jgi:uncharacterized protein YoxC
MKGKSALQVVLEQVKRLLQETEDRKIRGGPVPAEVKEQVADLEKIVSEFTDLSEKLLQRLGATPQEIQMATSRPSSHLSEEDAKVLQTGNTLLQQAKRKYAHLSLLMRAVKSRGEVNVNTGKSKVIGKARQKKFRRIGGKDSWRPM